MGSWLVVRPRQPRRTCLFTSSLDKQRFESAADALLRSLVSTRYRAQATRRSATFAGEQLLAVVATCGSGLTRGPLAPLAPAT